MRIPAEQEASITPRRLKENFLLWLHTHDCFNPVQGSCRNRQQPAWAVFVRSVFQCPAGQRHIRKNCIETAAPFRRMISPVLFPQSLQMPLQRIEVKNHRIPDNQVNDIIIPPDMQLMQQHRFHLLSIPGYWSNGHQYYRLQPVTVTGEVTNSGKPDMNRFVFPSSATLFTNNHSGSIREGTVMTDHLHLGSCGWNVIQEQWAAPGR